MAEIASTLPGVSEPLTWSEICERHPEEWVVLVEVDWINDMDLEFRSARVAGHGKRRKDPLEQARPLRSQYSAMAHLFTGRIRLPLTPLLFA
jgi:hypothetical protein